MCLTVNMQDGKGLVSTEDLQRVCDEYELGVSRHTLDGLMEFCDVDNDGIINFVEFANYLNWKDKMLVKPKEQRILLNGPLRLSVCSLICIPVLVTLKCF